jgi:enhancing lycopene biosynthesis protein 2
MFLDAQFRRAIEVGAISTLPEDLKHQRLDAYAATSRANHASAAEIQEFVMKHGQGNARNLADGATREAQPLIDLALRSLVEVLSSDA